MQIAIAQLNAHIGNFERNEQKIIAQIKTAASEGAEIIFFPELAICGAPPEDLLKFKSFITKAEESIERIAAYCQKISAIIGGPYQDNQMSGKPLYNAAYYISEGKIQSKHYKTLLNDEAGFDEKQYFEPANTVNCIQHQGKKIALTIGEDIWGNTSEKSQALKSPMEQLIQENPDFIVNISASRFSFKAIKRRSAKLGSIAKKYKTPTCMVNQVGANADLIFNGSSAVFNDKGDLIKKCANFQEDFLIFDSHKKSNKIAEFSDDKYALIEHALCLGIKDYFSKLNFKKATLGLSGGIDSALSLALVVKALGAENVKPLLLPSQFSSEHSLTDAIQLCENLACDYHIINITPIYDAFNQQLESLFEGREFDITEENIQARVRGTLLMAQSNKFGDILLNTSNKSELAVGYGTLYGDLTGGLSILGDLYKTEVYKLSKYMNREKELIPINIIEKPPSAELRPDQKDSDSLPDYDTLDRILHDYIELEKEAAEIIASGQAEAMVKKVLNLVNQSEFKRRQSMPILTVSDKSLDRGRKTPLVARFP